MNKAHNHPFYVKPSIWFILSCLVLLSLGVSGTPYARAIQVGRKAEIATISNIILIPGTVEVDKEIESALVLALGRANTIYKGAKYFAVTDIREVESWYFISTLGLVKYDNNRGWSLEDSVWVGMVLIERDQINTFQGAVEGTTLFSELLDEVPERIINRSSKNSIDPLRKNRTPFNTTSGYIFPWQSGTSMFYGSAGVHTNGFISDWKAVDMMSDGNTGAGHAPNRLLAAASGSIGYICRDSNNVAIRIDNLFYTHLVDNSNLTLGKWFNQGDEMGQMKTGTFGTTGVGCGWATQGSNWFHVHWGFPNADLQVEGWTLSMATQNWTKGSTTVSPNNWGLTAGGGSCKSLPSGYTKCADEGGFCSFSGTKEVYYGANSCYYSKSLSNGTACTNDVFGDPVYGVTKACYIQPDNPCNNPSPSSGQIGIYENDNYCGNYKILGLGEYPNPGSMGFSNDSASSIKVGDNTKAILCKDDNYSGGCEDFISNDPSLGDNSIGDNQVSSVKVQSNNTCNSQMPNDDQIILYEHGNYDGVCKILSIGEYPDPGAMGFANDTASSIKVGNSVKAILFVDANYSGGFSEFLGDDPDFGDDTIGHDRTSSVKVQVRQSLKPDLVIQGITASPSNPFVNQPVTFTILIKNEGTADASTNFYVDFFIDRQPIDDCSDTGEHFWEVSSLAAGASEELSYVYDGFDTSGTHYLYAFADTNCFIDESNENNNILGPENLDVSGSPDLVVQSITASPSNPSVNQPVTFTILIKNEGTADASTNFYVDFFIDRQPLDDCSDTGEHFWEVSSLAAGATEELSYVYYSFNTSGTHYLYAFADTNCFIDESNENNNILGPENLNVISGTTANFRSQGLYDGHILEYSEFSNKGGTANATATTLRVGDTKLDKQYRSILSFNTSTLPDNAVFTSAVLKIKKQGLVGTNPFTTHQGLKVDIRKPYFGSSIALQVSDFQAAGSLVTGTFDNIPWAGWYSVILTSDFYPYINKTGTTQFRVRFRLDDNNDMGDDYMLFYSGNYITNAYRPMLIIKYNVP